MKAPLKLRVAVPWFVGGVPLLASLVAFAACSGSSSGAFDPDGGGGTGSSSGSFSGSSSGSFAGSSSGTSSGSSSGSLPGSSSGSPPSGSSSGSSSGGPPSSGLFANCSLADGCVADCSPPANDPLATPTPDQYDIYDGCIIAGLEAGGFPSSSVAWIGGLLKGEAIDEGGQITSSVTTDTGMCGGQNCGMIAISAGKPSGDDVPGPCGSSSTDPFTGQVDYSHSYGLFQDTPACEGTFILSALPSGYTCTGTGNDGYGGPATLPFTTSDTTFYCESATGNGVQNLSGQTVSGVIDAITNTSDPYYRLSVFNPAYNLYVHLGYSLKNEYQQANQGSSGCTEYQMMYKAVAYWLNGDMSSDCSVPSGGGQGGNLQYIQGAISNYEMIYGQSWPYPQPM
jgi:hypothetical protein